jgi:hypothetical protein
MRLPYICNLSLRDRRDLYDSLATAAISSDIAFGDRAILTRAIAWLEERGSLLDRRS